MCSSNPGAGIFAKPVHMAGLAASQKEKPCDCCKRYADHLHDKMKCFLCTWMLILGMARDSTPAVIPVRLKHCSKRTSRLKMTVKMIIPKKFIDHFRGKISRTIGLESPNGNLYVVEVSKQMGNTVLRHGWQAFIDAHHIEENDSLLFRHIENTRFEVVVLDSDDCEKVFFCPGINIACNVEERGVDSVSISNSSCDYTKRSPGSKRFATCERSSHPRKAAKMAVKYSSSEDSGEDTENANTDILYSSSEDSGDDTGTANTDIKPEGSEDSGNANTDTIYSSSEDPREDTEPANTDTEYSSSGDSGEYTEDIPSEYESSFELDDTHTPSWHDYILARRSTLSRVQEEKVNTLLQDIPAENPVFVAVMKLSCVKSQPAALVIPKQYADEHFPHKSQTVTLQRPGKSKKWHPRFYIRKDQHVTKLSGRGWLDFVRDRRIQVGDICIFKRTKVTGRKLSLTVHLLRKSMLHSIGESGTCPKRVSSTHGKTRVNSAAPKVSTTDGRTRAKATSTTYVRKEPGENATYCVRSHGHGACQGHVESDKSRGPRTPPYIISPTACLNRELEMNVYKRARCLQSGVPIYVSIMNKSSVGNNLYSVNICKKYAAQYLPSGEQTVTLMRAEMSKTWEVKVHPRTGGAKVLRRGWCKFVHNNHLKVKDICLFQLMTDQRKLTMMVDIIRHNGKR